MTGEAERNGAAGVVEAPAGRALSYRVGAGLMVVGLAIFGTALVFHPLLADPRAVEHGLGEVARTPAWEAIHWAGATGLFLWLLGLTGMHAFFRDRGAATFSPYAVAAVVAALPLWLLVMVLEAGAMPHLARAYVGADGPDRAAVLLVARPLYAFGNLLGYVAAFLHWTAVNLWGMDVTRSGALPRWFGWWGWLAGAAAALALPLAVAWPRGAVLVLVATSGPAALWTLAAAWFLWRAADPYGR